MHGDARLAGRLVANLADNAIRYNIPGGRVEIVTALKAGRPVLLVANTGPPVPGSQTERLLQPFHRLAPGRTGQPDGHGLGLSIAQAIAAAHDATLTASPRPGGGLAVEVTFPPPAAPSGRSGHSQVPAASAATAPRPGPAPGQSRQPRRQPGDRPAGSSPKAQVARQTLAAGIGATASGTVIVGQVGFSRDPGGGFPDRGQHHDACCPPPAPMRR